MFILFINGIPAISGDSLVVASKAYLTASIAIGQAQKSRVYAVRIMTGRAFYIWPVHCGFAGYGVDRVGARKKI